MVVGREQVTFGDANGTLMTSQPAKPETLTLTGRDWFLYQAGVQMGQNAALTDGATAIRQVKHHVETDAPELAASLEGMAKQFNDRAAQAQKQGSLQLARVDSTEQKLHRRNYRPLIALIAITIGAGVISAVIQQLLHWW